MHISNNIKYVSTTPELSTVFDKYCLYCCFFLLIYRYAQATDKHSSSASSRHQAKCFVGFSQCIKIYRQIRKRKPDETSGFFVPHSIKEKIWFIKPTISFDICSNKTISLIQRVLVYSRGQVRRINSPNKHSMLK